MACGGGGGLQQPKRLQSFATEPFQSIHPHLRETALFRFDHRGLRLCCTTSQGVPLSRWPPAHSGHVRTRSRSQKGTRPMLGERLPALPHPLHTPITGPRLHSGTGVPEETSGNVEQWETCPHLPLKPDALPRRLDSALESTAEVPQRWCKTRIPVAEALVWTGAASWKGTLAALWDAAVWVPSLPRKPRRSWWCTLALAWELRRPTSERQGESSYCTLRAGPGAPRNIKTWLQRTRARGAKSSTQNGNTVVLPAFLKAHVSNANPPLHRPLSGDGGSWYNASCFPRLLPTSAHSLRLYARPTFPCLHAKPAPSGH